MHDVRLLSVGLQYVTCRLIKHMVDGRISGVRISKFQIRGIPRPQLLDPQTVDRVRTPQTTTTDEHKWLCVQCSLFTNSNKTAELSQRRPRDASNIWVPWKVSRVLTPHPATFPETYNGLLFRSILRMCAQNLKFAALPVPEIIGGTQKIWAVPGYAQTPFSPKILKGFCSDGPCECTCQIWSS